MQSVGFRVIVSITKHALCTLQVDLNKHYCAVDCGQASKLSSEK